MKVSTTNVMISLIDAMTSNAKAMDIEEGCDKVMEKRALH